MSRLANIGIGLSLARCLMHKLSLLPSEDNKCNIDGALQKAAKYLKEDCLQGCYRSAPHQYNETYFSALGEDARSYLLSRYAAIANLVNKHFSRSAKLCM